jgi:hypothetical protein
MSGIKIPKGKGGIRRSVRERTFDMAKTIRKVSKASSTAVFVIGIAGEPDVFALAIGAERDTKRELARVENLLLKSLDKVRAFLAQAEAGAEPTVLHLGPDRDENGGLIH